MPTRWVVLTGLVVARLAVSFQLQSVAVVAPGLSADLELDAASVGSLIGLFMLPGIFLAIPGGLLGQWFGERNFVAACLVAMAAGGSICGLSEHYWLLWIGRLISGIGAVGVNVVMTKIVVDWFAGKEIATAMAVFLVGYPIGIALALSTLGYFATSDGWPLAFFATAAFSFVALVVFVTTYRHSDMVGTTAERTTRLTIGEIAMVSLSGLIWALYNAAYIIIVSFVPIYLVSEGLSLGTAASLVGVGIWVTMASSPFGGILVDKYRRSSLVIIVSVLIWAFGILLVIPWSHSVPLLTGLLIVTAVIGNLAPGPIVALTSEVVRPQARGAAMGIFYTWLYGGIALGPVLGGYAIDITGSSAAAIYMIAVLGTLTVIALGLFRTLQAKGFPSVICADKT